MYYIPLVTTAKRGISQMSLAGWFNRTVGAHQPGRRLVIVGAFLGYPLVLIGYAMLVATHRIDSLVWAPIAVLLMLLTGFGLLAIWLSVRDRAAPDSPNLDERERALGTRAHVLSYAVLATFLVAVAGVLATWLTFVGPLTLRMEDVAPWLIALGVYLPVLPSAALLWIEPDPLVEAADQ